jgi:hypothetical protein
VPGWVVLLIKFLFDVAVDQGGRVGRGKTKRT